MAKYTNDTITIGAIGGAIATVIMTLINLLVGLIGLAYTPPWVVAGNILLNTDVLYTPIGIVLSFAIQLMLGTGLGVIMSYTLRFSGRDHYILKAIGVGSLFFIGNTGIMQAVAQISPWMRSEISSTVMAIFNLQLVSLISSFIIAKYARFNAGVRS